MLWPDEGLHAACLKGMYPRIFEIAPVDAQPAPFLQSMTSKAASSSSVLTAKDLERFMEEGGPHDAPANARSCSCGIFAWRSRAHMFAEQDLADVRLDELTYMFGGLAVWGDVYLWGRVYEHERGYRAEFARPKTFWRLWSPLVDDRMVALAASYGAEIVDPPEPLRRAVGEILATRASRRPPGPRYAGPSPAQFGQLMAALSPPPNVSGIYSTPIVPNPPALTRLGWRIAETVGLLAGVALLLHVADPHPVIRYVAAGLLGGAVGVRAIRPLKPRK